MKKVITPCKHVLTFELLSTLTWINMPSLPDPEDWAVEEFGAANLGDASHATPDCPWRDGWRKVTHCSFPHALNDADLKTVYCFFDNPPRGKIKL
ncbi:MAG: transposase [Zoogloeaceae bacterium]|jgi:hypothetical protein|nr:transposase [Zoogloeaceae bacterium]